tara:strand:+ start:734 stop:1000 length:267 start_codon:yes stop_codon:yes gene_type:complete
MSPASPSFHRHTTENNMYTFPLTPFRDLPFWAQQARTRNENELVLRYVDRSPDGASISDLEGFVAKHGIGPFRLRIIIRRLQSLGHLE